MTPKIGTLFVLVGCCVALAGLAFLPAGFGPPKDAETLTAGGALFSLGMAFAACGMYMKARYWAQLAPARSGKKGSARPCNSCSKGEAVIQCRVHDVHLCVDCLTQHYDFRACAYVPSTTQTVSKQTLSKSRAQAGA